MHFEADPQPEIESPVNTSGKVMLRICRTTANTDMASPPIP